MSKYGNIRAFEIGKSMVGASFTWCSLVDGLRLLVQGLQWEVGDGRTVIFWLDK